MAKKSKAKIAKQDIGAIFRYIKSRRVTVLKLESPYEVAARLLVRDGFPEPTTSLRAYCLERIEFIREEGNGYKADKPAKRVHRIGVPTLAKTQRATKPAKAFPTSEGVRVDSPEFLGTFAWRRLRMEALKLHGARCQCCGASPAEGAVMNVDHIRPRKLFPELALVLTNLQILCGPCNHGKGNWDQTDWRPVVDVDVPDIFLAVLDGVSPK